MCTAGDARRQPYRDVLTVRLRDPGRETNPFSLPVGIAGYHDDNPDARSRRRSDPVTLG